jgi:hypothetical protein
MGQTATYHFDGLGTGATLGSETGLDVTGPLRAAFRTSGAPVNGGSGTFVNKAPKYSLLIRTDTGVVHMNTGTLASPTWTIITGTP